MDLLPIILQAILTLVILVVIMVAAPFLLMLVFSFAYSNPPRDPGRRRPGPPQRAHIGEDDAEEDEDEPRTVEPASQ